MWTAPGVALLAGVWLCGLAPIRLIVCAPFLAAWLFAPLVAWWISRPLQAAAPKLNAEQSRLLRSFARRTWRYFETYVGEESLWLPPDNVQ